MNSTDVIEVVRDGIATLLVIASPILLAALIVGLIIGILQALTQIQEMTLVFVPKIFAIFLMLLIMLPFMIGKMTTFAETLFDKMIGLS